MKKALKTRMKQEFYHAAVRMNKDDLKKWFKTWRIPIPTSELAGKLNTKILTTTEEFEILELGFWAGVHKCIIRFDPGFDKDKEDEFDLWLKWRQRQYESFLWLKRHKFKDDIIIIDPKRYQ